MIISASGTADAGRVRHHVRSAVSDRKNGILLAGYCGGASIGGKLLSRCPEIEIFSQPLKVRARVGQLCGMSAHGDADDLLKFLESQDAQKVKGIFLVHGEETAQQIFADRLSLKGFRRIECPQQQQSFELPLKAKRKRIPLKEVKRA